MEKYKSKQEETHRRIDAQTQVLDFLHLMHCCAVQLEIWLKEDVDANGIAREVLAVPPEERKWVEDRYSLSITNIAAVSAASKHGKDE